MNGTVEKKAAVKAPAGGVQKNGKMLTTCEARRK